MKNFVHAGSFARRAIELGAPPEISKQAKKVLQSCDKSPTNAVDMDYDAHNPFKVCAESFTPIYKGTPSVRASSLSVSFVVFTLHIQEECPYCGAHYLPKFNGMVCNICQVAKVGKDCAGLTLHKSQLR